MRLYGRSWALLLLLLVWMPLISCGKFPSFLSGGTNVAANTQVGKTNTQTVGQTNNISPSVSLRPKARVDTIDQSNDTINNYDLPVWVWVVGLFLFVVGWVTDTPYTYIQRLRGR